MLLALLVSGCASLSPGSRAAADDEAKLVVMGTTDTHGWLFPFDYDSGESTEHGLLLLAPVIDSIRAAHPGRTLLVDSGDLLQGNPLAYVYRSLPPGERHPVIEAMNWLGYDAAAIGNNDFAYGIEHLDRATARAEFTFLSANTFEYGTDSHAYEPSVMVEREVGGRRVRIGITGVTPPGVLIRDLEHVSEVLDFREIVGSVRPVVERLRQDGADIVIVASHGGLESSSYDTAVSGVAEENMAEAIAREIPGIDVIFMGHTHREVADTTISGTLLVQGKNWGTSLAVAELTLRPEPGGRWSVVGKQGVIRGPAARAPEVPASLYAAHERTREYVAREIGRSRIEMTSRTSRVEDTPILDFINEVKRSVTGADLSSTAAFTTTARIPEGPVTMADVAEMYVYDNTLKAVRISGADLRAYLEKSAEYYLPCPAGSCDRLVNPEIPGYNFDVVTGVDYTLDVSRPVGQRVVRLDREGAPVQPTDSFTLALTNDRASGAGGFTMLANAPVVYSRGEEIRDLLIEEVERRGTLDPADFHQRNWDLVPVDLRRQALLEQGAGWAAPGEIESEAGASGRKRLRVIGVNDFHGNLLPQRRSFAGGREVGGAPALATYFRLTREAVDAPTVLLDGGDTLQGTPLSNLSEGRATVDFYNAVGFHAAALGNHEFDWGVGILRDRLEQAEFPWLSANFFMAGTDTLPSWMSPTRTVVMPGCAAGPPACDPVTVGIIGLSTAETPTVAMPSHVVDFDFGDEAETIDRWVPILREQGVDFVIVTIHEGAYCSELMIECQGPIIDIAARLRHRPDLIVSGHSHTQLNLRSGGVPIVQASSQGARFSIVDMERVSADSVAVFVREQPVTYTDLVEPDSAIAARLESYLEEYGPLLREVVTRLDEDLPRSDGEYALGNLIADAQRRATAVDVAFMNNGGIRTELRAGPITYEDLFRLQPFANTMVTMDVTGEQLMRLLEHTVARGRPHAHVSGVRVRYSDDAPRGERVRSAILDDGRPVDRARVYRLAANNFMAEGGDGYVVLLEGSRIEHTGIVDLDALIDYLRHLPSPARAPAADRFLPID